jgi:hypothetical protein
MDVPLIYSKRQVQNWEKFWKLNFVFDAGEYKVFWSWLKNPLVFKVLSSNLTIVYDESSDFWKIVFEWSSIRERSQNTYTNFPKVQKVILPIFSNLIRKKKHNKKPFVTWQFFGTGPQSEDFAENVSFFIWSQENHKKYFCMKCCHCDLARSRKKWLEFGTRV